MIQTPPEPRPDSPPPAASSTETPPPSKTYQSAELFQGRREVYIQHGQALYRLRITSQGRLILTK